jgi:uncharacterized protein (UPF0179 family)
MNLNKLAVKDILCKVNNSNVTVKDREFHTLHRLDDEKAVLNGGLIKYIDFQTSKANVPSDQYKTVMEIIEDDKIAQD